MPNPLRERNAKVNKLVQEAILSLPHAFFLNVDPGFVHSDGSISHQDMYDYLHLTPQGYQAVCENLHAHLKSMLDEPSENWATRAQIYTTATVLILISREHQAKLIYILNGRMKSIIKVVLFLEVWIYRRII